MKPIKHAQQHSYVDRLISLKQELNRLYEDMSDHLSTEELDILDGDDPISNTHAAHDCVQDAINGMKSFFVVQAGAIQSSEKPKLNSKKWARLSPSGSKWAIDWYEDKDPKEPKRLPLFHTIYADSRNEAINKAKQAGIILLRETVGKEDTSFSIASYVVQAGLTTIVFDGADGMSTTEFKEYFESLGRKLEFGKVSVNSGKHEVELWTENGEMMGYFSSGNRNGEIVLAETPSPEIIKEIRAFLGGKANASRYGKVKINVRYD